MNILLTIAIATIALVGGYFLLNRLSLCYFRRKMRSSTFLPIVNTRGDVIGKSLAESTLCMEKSEHIYPVVRIAISVEGRLFLLPRPVCSCHARGETDLPIEGHLIFGESIEQGIERILNLTLPNAPREGLHFHLMHHFENDKANLLVYLFTWELTEEALRAHPDWRRGKLWTQRQIADNLEKGYFAECFELEFEWLPKEE